MIQSRGQRFLGLANKSAPKRFVSEYVNNPHHANAPDDIRILLLALGADKLLTRKATDPELQFCHLETVDSILTWISHRIATGRWWISPAVPTAKSAEFVDLRDVKETLPPHRLRPGELYLKSGGWAGCGANGVLSPKR